MKAKTAEMKRSWLVQRLQRPFESVLGKDNPFAFGGGMRNGGLSDEAMGLLRGVFRFDYMGSAEFEWGAVPKALSRIAANADAYVTEVLPVPLAIVPPDWRDKDAEPLTGTTDVYLICRSDHASEVKKRVLGWASERTNDLKEQTQFAAALRPRSEWDRDRCGWLELDNGFFFFTDRAMWEATARLFGVDS